MSDQVPSTTDGEKARVIERVNDVLRRRAICYVPGRTFECCKCGATATQHLHEFYTAAEVQAIMPGTAISQQCFEACDKCAAKQVRKKKWKFDFYWFKD